LICSAKTDVGMAELKEAIFNCDIREPGAGVNPDSGRKSDPNPN